MPVVRVCADHLGEKERLGSLSKQGLLTILVFGASGDLAKKKTFPALYKLYLDGLLPKYINIVGYGRSSISREDFHSSIISKISPAFYNETAIQKFQSRCTYISGAYDSDEDFISLHSQLESLEQESLDIIKKSTTPYEEFVLCQEMISADDINNLTIKNSNRIIYMAVPPNQFVHIASMTSTHLRITPKSEHNLRASLRSPTYIVDSENNEIKSGMIRVIVEKPFGSDYQTAMKLQHSLAQLFHEEEIYRIDHYLGKEMVQSLLALRFANSSFAAAWDSKSIESVKITFKETVDTAGRAGYFDKFGITRDVMQNHLLQVLALIAMECPLSNSADDVRDAKLEVLKRLSVWDQEPTEDIAEAQIPMSPEYLVTGQYSGYLEEEGVAEGSKTETFSSAVFKIQNQRWQNVPFILKCAKGVEDSRVEIRVQFKVPQNNLFSKDTLVRNELVFRVQPDEAVYLKVLTKKPGLEGSLSSLEQTELDFTLKKRFKKEEKKEKILDESNSIILPDAYEKLIWDVTRNDPSLFVRADELQQAWIVFEPILQAFKQPQYQPTQYVKGKRGPIEADQLAKKVGFEFNDSYNWVERK